MDCVNIKQLCYSTTMDSAVCCASWSTSSASVFTVVYLTDSRENMAHKNSRMWAYCGCEEWGEGDREERERGEYLTLNWKKP